MLDVDKPAIMRAAGLLKAFEDGDEETFQGILISDYEGDPASAWRTFCAVFAYADRLADAIATFQGTTVAEVIDDVMPQLAAIAPE
jgi:hypothetical protein